MKYILVLNSGSETLKCRVFERKKLDEKFNILVERIGLKKSFLTYYINNRRNQVNFSSGIKDHKQALKEVIKIANEEAPEHLMLQVKNPKKYLNQLKNYGSLFLGDYSAVAFGDYCSGPNHVLPTDKTSRFTGGLSVKDFTKIQTYQYINKKGAEKLAKIAIKFASIEGLDAHKKSAEIREK